MLIWRVMPQISPHAVLDPDTDFYITVCQLNKGFQHVLSVEEWERDIKTPPPSVAYVVLGEGK